jgi:DNA-binding transcriptional ArsR family regulator
MLQGFKAELFKALGHPVRIRILELLRDGEMTVTELQTRLEIETSSVSQQLAVLRARQLVVGRKDGTSVYYRAADPQVYALLDAARALFERHLLSLQAMAEQDPAGPLQEVSGGLIAG